MQLVDLTRLVALSTDQRVDVSFDIGFVREPKQRQKVDIDLHLFDVVEALRQKENVQFVMVTVHGEELVDTFSRAAVLESHSVYVINHDLVFRPDVRFLDRL